MWIVAQRRGGFNKFLKRKNVIIAPLYDSAKGFGIVFFPASVLCFAHTDERDPPKLRKLPRKRPGWRQAAKECRRSEPGLVEARHRRL